MRARKRFEKLVATFGLQHVIDTLEPCLTEGRKKKINRVVQGRIESLSVAVEESCDVHNVLAGMRSAEAMGVTKIHLINCRNKRTRGKRTTQGAHKWVDLTSYHSLESFLKQKPSEVLLAGAAAFATMELEELPTDKPICLLFGNEHEGLSKKALNACDLHYSIPMVGMMESFNLSVSIALSLYAMTRKRVGDLGDVERERAYYYPML